MRGTDTDTKPYNQETFYELYGIRVDEKVYDKHQQALKALNYCIKQMYSANNSSGKLKYLESITKGL